MTSSYSHFLNISFRVTFSFFFFFSTPWVRGDELFSSETSVGHFRWGFSLTDVEIESKWRLIPEDVDVLISHMPPFGIGDTRRNYGKDVIVNDVQVLGFDNYGSVSLLDTVSTIQPAVHIFGHCHTGHGAFYKEGLPTAFINASICDEDYQSVNSPLVLDVEVSCDDVIAFDEAYEKPELDTAVAMMVSISDQDAEKTLSVACNEYLSVALSPRTQRDRSRLRRLAVSLEALLIEHNLLERLYQARVMSRGADEFANSDFRRMQMVLPNLYIGHMQSTLTAATLHEFGVTHICRVIIGKPPEFPDIFEYLVVEIDDDPEVNIAEHFEKCISFIDDAIHSSATEHVAGRYSAQTLSHLGGDGSGSFVNAREGGVVLVHCAAGMSRSASIVIAYVMYALGLPFEKAYVLVKRARPFICPNDGFMKQLKDFKPRRKKAMR